MFVSVRYMVFCGYSVVCEASEPSRKRIKRGEDIGYRQMQRYGKQVYEYVADTICAINESPTIYINAAVKESSLRSTTELKSVRRNIFNDDDENDLELSQIALHPAVAETLNNFLIKISNSNCMRCNWL